VNVAIVTFTIIIKIYFVSYSASSKCENPKVKATSYTPADAQVLTHIPFIAEFSLACSNGATDVLLYANINGALLPVVRSQDGTKYQVKVINT
jgi:translocon-associated protein subunit delta